MPLAGHNLAPEIGVLPRLMNTALGVWTMAAPGVLGYGRPLATSDWIAGPLVATFAIVAIWEILRPLRLVNVPLGLWIAAAPWILGAAGAARANGTIAGLAIAALALAAGRIEGRYAGGWREAWPFRRRSPA
jgi:hypothetical protein